MKHFELVLINIHSLNNSLLFVGLLLPQREVQNVDVRQGYRSNAGVMMEASNYFISSEEDFWIYLNLGV